MIQRLKTQWKRTWLPFMIAYGAKYAMRLLIKTCRTHIHGIDAFVNTATQTPCILMLWHNKLIIVSEILTRNTKDIIYTAFISKSRDGEPLAILAQSYKQGRVLRVPHNARHLALSKMISSLKNKREVVLITPDGPRGPRHIVKPGVVVAAMEASAKIVPFHWKADRFWELNTWDKMQIPKPFSTINITFGDALMVSGEIDASTEQLQQALHQFD